MSFIMKQMLGDKLKNGEVKSDGKETPASKGMSREEFEAFQKQLVEEKIERDKEFATKKAERANLRVALRDKYRLRENGEDEATLDMAGDDIDLPEELARMVDEDQEEEEVNSSLLEQLQTMDMDALKTKAQATMTDVKLAAEEKCIIM